ncbi:MAG: DUF3592 domain-containing protein [Vicinamibacterales bacterium]
MVIPTSSLIIGLAGVVVLALVWRQVGAGVRARRWRSTAATILDSRLDSGGVNPLRRSVRVHARYRYQASGITYIGERLAFTAPVRLQMEAAERRLRQLAAGKLIEIWYDPANPSRAVVDPRISWGHYVLAAAGAICVTEVLVTMAVALVAR